MSLILTLTCITPPAELGIDKITSESFAYIKILRHLPYSPLWTRCYVVLLRTPPSLYILQNKYDIREKSIFICVFGPGVDVERRGSTSVCLTSRSQGATVYVQFIAIDEGGGEGLPIPEPPSSI